MSDIFVAPFQRSALARYSLALAAVILGAFLRARLDALLGTRFAFLTLFPAVMVSGWFGGLGPGVFSAILSTAIADYFWFEPVGAFVPANPGDLVPLFIFLFTGAVMSALNERVHRGRVREMSARRAAEEAQRHAEAAEHRWVKIIEATPTAMIAVDQRGRIVFVNSLTERLFGYSCGELIGKPVEIVVPERFRRNHLQYRALFAIAPEMRQMGAGRELYAVRKDGSEVPVEIGLNPIDLGDEVLVLSSIVDITDRKRAEDDRADLLEAEQRARSEADAANRAKDLFLARASHELRTPLNALMGWTRMLRDGAIATGRVPTAIASIDRNAEVLSKLVEDLIDMSRITTGRLQLLRKHLDLAAVLRESVSLLEPAASAKQIRLETRIEPGVLTVDGDPTRLRQVFWNLVSNAIKFTDSDGRVIIRVRLTDADVEISVTDTGRGIASEFLPHVFEPFAQAEDGGSGLGLGLAIVQQLVKAHDGHITVTSAGSGSGATFTVRLPTVRIPERV
jgi:PAS domain S-box-containing protein